MSHRARRRSPSWPWRAFLSRASCAARAFPRGGAAGKDARVHGHALAAGQVAAGRKRNGVRRNTRAPTQTTSLFTIKRRERKRKIFGDDLHPTGWKYISIVAIHHSIHTGNPDTPLEFLQQEFLLFRDLITLTSSAGTSSFDLGHESGGVVGRFLWAVEAARRLDLVVGSVLETISVFKSLSFCVCVRPVGLTHEGFELSMSSLGRSIIRSSPPLSLARIYRLGTTRRPRRPLRGLSGLL